MEFFRINLKKVIFVLISEIVLYLVYRLFAGFCGIPEPGQGYFYCTNIIQWLALIIMALLILYLLASIVYSIIKNPK